MTKNYDIAIIGGGIMGCATALHLAQAGMSVILLEKDDIGQGASGVNAGTLSMQIKRVKLMPYALKGHHEWQKMGDKVGFVKTGGYTLAFNEREAKLLEERMKLKREAGANIEFVSPKILHENEPNISKRITAVSYCADDGYANSSLTGQYYRNLLNHSSVDFLEQSQVTKIDQSDKGFKVHTENQQYKAKRLLLACGGWMKQAAALLDIDLPIQARINTVSVTERSPKLIGSVIGHATGLLTMKQKTNGSVLIGGGWQGTGSPNDGRGKVNAQTLIPNIQLAQYALPALSTLRIIRSWTGFEANVPDFYPLAGALGNIPNAYILGCVRGGFTIGPYISKLMGDFILGNELELPLFDPNRKFTKTGK